MNREQIKDFLRDVAGPNYPLVDHTGWVSFPCLFGPYKHSGGADKHPSAGISVNDDKSIYNCQACHTKGPLGWILRELAECTGEDYSELQEAVEDEDLFGGSIPAWDAPKGEGRRLPDPLDETIFLDLYDTAYDHWYVTHRGIDYETAERLDLRLDPADSQGKERILFPVYHHNGGFYGFTGRATDPNVYPPIRDYHGLPKEFLLLGSHLLRDDDKRIILVEGLFDLAMMVQFDQPAVAMMGSFPTDRQVDALIDIGLPVYFFRDNDKAGLDAEDKLKDSRLCKHIPVMKVRYPKRRVCDLDGKVRFVQDPDELTPEEINEMQDDARLL